MASCAPFTIDFTISPEELVGKAKSAIEKAGGSFSGNTSAGSFDISSPVKVEGNYTVSGQTITLTVTEKPMIVPCSMIEAKLKEYLA